MLQIKDFTVNHRSIPRGVAGKPVFSWKLVSDREQVEQTQYVLTVGSHRQTGVSECVAIPYEGKELEAFSEIPVHLSVTDNHGETAEAETRFETEPAAFAGQWITGDGAVPVFEKEFSAQGVSRARLVASACGVYAASLNGQEVTQDLLTPGWTNYRKRIQYQVYDVTALLKEQNRLAFTVAPGWWSGYLNCENRQHYGKKQALFCELHLWMKNGTRRVILSDGSWQVTSGEVLSSELYHGETVDKTAIPAKRKAATVYKGMDVGRLVPSVCDGVRIFEKLPPKALLRTPKGETVLDFGQNIAGVVELKIKGERGQRITLRHAEVLDKDGNFYTTNLRSARAEDVFICSGGEDVFRPRFTYHGFRYVAVKGLGNDFDPDAFRACVMHSALQETAAFSCSDARVNRLWENIRWSMRDNFMDIPTDCPQRDERLGWTGDAAIFSHTAGQLCDTYAFFRKWLADLESEQSDRYGVPDTVPNILTAPDSPGGGSAVWGDAATLVPWAQYRLSGDSGVLAAQYESMKRWVEYMRAHETQEHLHKYGHQRGDWLALDREEGRGVKGSTDRYLISTAFYAESTRILAESAAILHKKEDARYYGELYRAIVEGFRREFITLTGRVVTETQTALSLILCLGLASPEQEAVIARTLADNLAAHQGKLTTGFIGTPYLLKALSMHSLHDLAGKLLLNEDYPGWLYEVKHGATTIWEHWDSVHEDGSFDESGMNSFNHYSFGAIGAWMLEDLAGIQAAEPGYRRIRFRPRLTQGLTEVSAERETPYGRAACAWRCKNGKITVSVTVPANSEAELFLPEREDGIRLKSGTYSYDYATETSTEPRCYTMDSSVAQLRGNPLFSSGVERMLPGAAQHLSMAFLQSKTLRELLGMMPSGAESALQEILDEMNG